MPRLVRDPVTWLTYGQLAIFGYFLYGFTPAVALLRDEQHVSSGMASLHGTAMAAGALVAGAAFPALARRIGRGRAMWAGLTGMAVAVGGLCTLRALPATLTCTLLAAVCGVALVSGVVASLGERHGRSGAAAIAEANAVACGLGALAPLAIGVSVAAGWTWRPAVALVIVLAVAAGAVAVLCGIRIPAGEAARRAAAARSARASAPEDAAGSARASAVVWAAGSVRASGPVDAAESVRASAPVDARAGSAQALGPLDAVRSGQAAPPTAGSPAAVRPRGGAVGEVSPPVAAGGLGAGRLPAGYWIAWVLISLTGSVEVCLNLWSGDVLRQHAGMSAGAAATAVAGIIAGMCAGRLIGGRIALRVAAPPLLLAALGVSALGFAVFWAAPQPWLAVTGLAVTGLGNGMHYPLGIAMALQASAGRPDQAAARSSYGMAVSFGVAPFALGALADQAGARPAFLLVPLFLLAAAALVPPLARRLPPPAAPTPLPRRPESLPAAA